MDLLVLGGTVFLGRWIVATTRERGHRVTLFTRGLTNSSLFPDVPKLRGDRDGDLAALADGRWDAVIDTSGYVPRVVEQSARLLEPRADHYTFVSSISAYASFERSVREHSPLARLDDGAGEDVQEHYGALKSRLRDSRAGRLWRACAGLATWPDRRAARPHGALHLLDLAHRRRR